MPSLVVIGPQVKEKQVGTPGGGHNVPPAYYMVPKDPSLYYCYYYQDHAIG